MALLFCDSFDHYTGTAQMLLKWTSIAGGAMPNISGRNGTTGVRFGGSGAVLIKSFSPAITTCIAGMAAYRETNISETLIIMFRDSADANQINTRLNSDGSISIVRGSVGGTVLATSTIGGSTPAISVGVWHYYEFKATIDNVSGYAEVKVDGVIYVTYSGDTQATSNANIQSVYLNNSSNSGAWGIDDLYICNSTSPNGDFLGDVKVECKYTIATGTYSQWSPSSGTVNYLNVDETTPDGDVTYNYASGTALVDLFNFSDLSTISGEVFGVQQMLYARKDDAGSRSIAPIFRRNSINVTGSVLSLGDSYAYYMSIMDQDPSVTGSWTISNFNDSEWGYEMIS